ncbi:MAG: universal stress protein [Anaerolineales bacterium]|nr:universal stress protein [Anaerolineales bacterium]
MFNEIVVPLDGSPLAERALPPARALAQHIQTPLRLVSVAVARQMLVPDEVGFGVLYPDQSLVQARGEAANYLANLLAATPAGAPRQLTDLREGDVAGEIVDAARQAAAGLIVMSSHGYSGFKRWLLGSIAEKVLYAAPCPVWVVRTPEPPQHLLVTLDGSQLAEEVLLPALTVARCFGAKLTLLRVISEISGPDIQALDTYERGLGRRFVDQSYDEAAGYLALVAENHTTRDLRLDTAVRSGPAAEVILEYAETQSVDLVAMTTHGRTGLRRWVYGSVTHKVLDQLPLSMLVARSHGANLS